MIILGIDPGTTIVGYALIRKIPYGAELIEAGAIRTKNQNPGKKLEEIKKAVNRLIDIHKPSLVALEKIFFSKNIKTALSVAEARGVIILTAAENHIRVCEYTPLEAKIAVTGYGRADKRQVKEMVRLLLKQTEVPNLDDITDAMAIAFTALGETSQAINT